MPLFVLAVPALVVFLCLAVLIFVLGLEAFFKAMLIVLAIGLGAHALYSLFLIAGGDDNDDDEQFPDTPAHAGESFH